MVSGVSVCSEEGTETRSSSDPTPLGMETGGTSVGDGLWGRVVSPFVGRASSLTSSTFIHARRHRRHPGTRDRDPVGASGHKEKWTPHPKEGRGRGRRVEDG